MNNAIHSDHPQSAHRRTIFVLPEWAWWSVEYYSHTWQIHSRRTSIREHSSIVKADWHWWISINYADTNDCKETRRLYPTILLSTDYWPCDFRQTNTDTLIPTWKHVCECMVSNLDAEAPPVRTDDDWMEVLEHEHGGYLSSKMCESCVRIISCRRWAWKGMKNVRQLLTDSTTPRLNWKVCMERNWRLLLTKWQRRGYLFSTTCG